MAGAGAISTGGGVGGSGTCTTALCCRLLAYDAMIDLSPSLQSVPRTHGLALSWLVCSFLDICSVFQPASLTLPSSTITFFRECSLRGIRWYSLRIRHRYYLRYKSHGRLALYLWSSKIGCLGRLLHHNQSRIPRRVRIFTSSSFFRFLKITHCFSFFSSAAPSLAARSHFWVNVTGTT